MPVRQACRAATLGDKSAVLAKLVIIDISSNPVDIYSRIQL
jgi:hypothetical protein